MCGSRAHAQDEDPSLQRAVVLFEESEVAYNEGRFDEAVALLRRAYALHEDPTLLFNLARALEGMGDLDEAIETYERYLAESPDAEDRGAIEARLRTLRTQRDRLADEGEEGEGEAPIEGGEETAPSTPGRSVDPVPWIVAGAGAVVVGVGAVFGVVSQNKAAAARDEMVQVDASNLHAEASTFATLANVFFIVGGLVTVGGATWGVVSLTSGGGEDEASAEAALVPGGVVVRGRF
jgi:tetratricopeptide (TPR) repeat protein